MARVLTGLSLVIAVLTIFGCVAMMGLFALTTVGLTVAEKEMLTMTSGQINVMRAQSLSILNTLESFQNFTEKLVTLNSQLLTINLQQDGNNVSTQVLVADAAQREIDLLAYNATIESQFIVIQNLIDNITLPLLNLTLEANTTQLGNGTVVLLNPNNVNENTTLEYVIKQQLGNVFVLLPAASLDYATVGGSNWITLTDWEPRLFVNVTTATGAGQILDDQRDKITSVPAMASRQYSADEVRFVFDGAVGGAQTVTFNEAIEFNVGFI